jgi:hypothetical protein
MKIWIFLDQVSNDYSISFSPEKRKFGKSVLAYKESEEQEVIFVTKEFYSSRIQKHFFYSSGKFRLIFPCREFSIPAAKNGRSYTWRK